MKFATFFDAQGTEQAAVVMPETQTLYPLAQLGVQCTNLVDFIARYTPETAQQLQQALPAATGLPLAQQALCAPIPRPRHDILCVGQNYLAHALESADFLGQPYVKPAQPTYFSKRVDTAVPTGGIIPAHQDITQKLDYEAELAVILGKPCSHVKPEDVFDYIFGYTVANDVSARDLQVAHGQYTFGKGLDGFAPMGPWIVTKDEFATPPHLQVQTRVNGALRQNGNTSDFIFDIPTLISQLSAGILLQPGDILLTGTPSGVAMGMQTPVFLQPGDVVECEIEGIGVLRNTVG